MRAPLTFVLLAASVAATTFACGGASSPLVDGDDTGGDASTKRDASTKGDSSTGSCVHPTFGESCTTSQSVCGQVGEGNPCCDQAWRCVGGTWQSLAGECACVEAACGDTICGSDQYCFVQPPGVAFEDGGVPDTNYTCLNLPSTCSGVTPTCDCIEAANPCSVASCSAAGGLITVSCIGE